MMHSQLISNWLKFWIKEASASQAFYMVSELMVISDMVHEIIQIIK